MVARKAIIQIGHSYALGTAPSSSLATLAPELVGASDVAWIWRDMPVVNRAFEQLEPGVNTLLDAAGGSLPFFGPETKGADGIARYLGEDIYVIKDGWGGSRLCGSPTIWDDSVPGLEFRPSVSAPSTPAGQTPATVRNDFLWSWHADDMMRAIQLRIARASAWLAANGGHTLDVIAIWFFMGETDSVDQELADSYLGHLKGTRDGFRKWLVDGGYAASAASDPAAIQFVSTRLQVDEQANNINTTPTAPMLTTRDAQWQLGFNDVNTKVVDLKDVPLSVDKIHPSEQGFLDIGDLMWQAQRDPSVVDPGVAPTFVKTKEILEKALRLSGVGDTKDAQEQIDRAIQAAGVTLFRYLGGTRIAQLQAIPCTARPTTQPEHERAMAEDVEIKLCRLELLPVLRVVFMESGGDVHEAWNQEDLHARSARELKQELSRLRSEVDSMLAVLAGSASFTNLSGSQFMTVERDSNNPAPRPGQTVYGLTIE